MNEGLAYDAFDALAGLLEAGRPCRIPVRGVSMLPFLREGDTLHLVPAAPGDLRLGDLMAFRREAHLVVHRFAGRVRRGGVLWLRQMGDNTGGHSLVRPEDLVGRVAMVDSGLGARPMLEGRGKWVNGALGVRAWLVCVVRETLAGLPRP